MSSEVQKVGRDIAFRATVVSYNVVDPVQGGSALGSVVGGLKARLSVAASGQHVEWVIRIICEGKEWQVKKRFSEIAQLHDIISKRLPNLPALPAKSAVRHFTPEYLESRKAALDMYFEFISKRRDFNNCPEMHQFFGLIDMIPGFKANQATDPVQSAEVHESAFGIVDFSYDQLHGMLLLGSSDRSWTSRLDTKLTNIKLPWEPNAPNLPSSQMSMWRQSSSDLRFELQFMCRYQNTISCVAILMQGADKGLCLCGLGDGTVGYHSIKAESGVNSAAQTLPLLRHTAAVAAIAVDEGEQWVFTASKDCAVTVYDAKKQILQCEVQTTSPATVLRHAPAQKRLFSGLQSGKVLMWDTSMLPIQQLAVIPDGAVPDPMHTFRIGAMDYDVATNMLFTACEKGLTLWAVKSSSSSGWGRKAGSVPDITGRPTSIVWATSSRELMVGFESGAVVIFDTEVGAPSFSIQAHDDALTSMVWLDAPRRLLTAGMDKKVKIWDFPSLRRIALEDQWAFRFLEEDDTAPTAGAASSGRGTRRGSGEPKPLFAPGADPLAGVVLAPTGLSSSSSAPTGEREETRREERFTPAARAPLPANPLEALARPSAPKVTGAKPGTVTSKADSDDDLLATWG